MIDFQISPEIISISIATEFLHSVLGPKSSECIISESQAKEISCGSKEAQNFTCQRVSPSSGVHNEGEDVNLTMTRPPEMENCNFYINAWLDNIGSNLDCLDVESGILTCEVVRYI